MTNRRSDLDDDIADTRWLTTEDVSRRIQVSVETLKQWRRRGKGPPWRKVGWLVRYHPDDLAAWIEDDK